MKYQERIDRVCSYIIQNLEDDLSLERLSSIAALSKYHFHRVFLSCTGMTLFKFIQLSRFKRATFQLAFANNKKIIDIALDAGFDSPEAFTRSFKNIFGQTPTQFRKHPEWDVWHTTLSCLENKGVNVMNVRIVQFPETKIALLQHQGAPANLMQSVARFIDWRKSSGCSPVKTSKTIGIPHSDPEQTPPELFRFDICGSIEGDIPDNDHGVTNGIIPGGRCAVVRHEGSLDNISDSVYYLYRDWLPDSGEELRDFPCFFHYLKLQPETDECDLLTDIHLPIQ